MKYLLILLLLVGCGEKVITKTVEVIVEIEKIVEIENTELNISTEYIDQSSYWCIKQYFGEYKDAPKYCLYGTSTHKHGPLAFYANEELFHVYTDNSRDENFYIIAAKGNNEKVIVHTIENWEDVHSNASIHVLDSGIVHVHVSARGINRGYQSGKILASKTPYQLDFECIDGCDNDNIEGYPQVWLTSWGEHVNYSHNIFEYDIHPKQWMRSPHYRVGDVRKQLVRGGHYYISYYDGETMYMAYNLLIDGHPDNRINLYLIKTNDGVNWVTLDNKPLILPLSQHNEEAMIYESTGYIYLKDISVDDGLKILFTESTDYDPTKGERMVKEFKADGIREIASTNHNYNGAAYIGDNIILTNGENNGWIGGDIILYENYIETARDSSSNCSYVRKVINKSDKAVISCDNFHLNNSASHYILTLD